MNYEEKYKEALERAKKVKHDIENIGCSMAPDILEVIFPELAESEDERIRKFLVNYFKEVGKSWIHRDINPEQIIAYLEKQKEQKPAEFTHHEIDESLCDAVTHQMEDDGDIDDFVRRGIDDIALKYAELGAKWQKEQKPEWSEGDERILKGIIGKIDHDQTYGVSKVEMLSFLEELRPSWKPSEEQDAARRK